jgi:Leucine-rich repeat (LRR) protein
LFHLHDLDLSDNQLSTLPKELAGLENLRFLDLRNNNFTELPAVLSEFSNLQELYLSDNALTEEQVEAARAMFPNAVVEF